VGPEFGLSPRSPDCSISGITTPWRGGGVALGASAPFRAVIFAVSVVTLATAIVSHFLPDRRTCRKSPGIYIF